MGHQTSKQKKDANSTSTSSFSQDLIIEVFSKLPVKSLVRFKSVSKSWHSVITDSNFTRMHTKQGRLFIYSGEVGCHSLDCAALVVDNASYDEAMVNLQLPKKIIASCNRFHIIGSCNGLFCISNEKGIYIWNPSTGDFKSLAMKQLYDGNCGYFGGGFGYNKSIDDYKMVILSRNKEQIEAKVDVLNLKKNTWRSKIEKDFNYKIKREFSGVFVNGALHWLGLSSLEVYGELSVPLSIVSFDLEEEKFQVISQPDSSILYRTLSVLGGCLCICYTPYLFDREGEGIDVWIMKESWTKLFIVPNEGVLDNGAYLSNFIPLCFTRDGQIIIGMDVDSGILVKCNLRENSFKSICSQYGKKLNLLKAIVYEETLLSPNYVNIASEDI